MLKKYGQIFLSALFISDCLAIIGSWVASYYIRFNSSFLPSAREVPPIEQYVFPLLIVVVVFLINIKGFDLYQPPRGKSLANEFILILKVTSSSILILAAVTFFYRGASYSRLTVLIFWVLVTLTMIFGHGLLRWFLMELRRQGFNLQRVLIVGTGQLGQAVADKIDLHPEIGFEVVGYLTDRPEKISSIFGGHKVLGIVKDVSKIIESERIGQLFIALPLDAYDRLEEVLAQLGEERVDVKVVPDLLRFMNLSSGVEDFDGLPVISLTGSPLYGWNIVLKRIIDIVCSVLGIILTIPLMVLIAILVKLESRGRILYIQDRVGFDGKIFPMLKFRSMREGAEKVSGPVWAMAEDNRRTWIGKILRKTSLDELPQFFNILKGDMSFVGPRPERPIFVDNFKKNIPHYMLRLKMKAGLTGWAQINGWRGNTSLEKRIEYDLYYIKHWSIWFDLKIIVMTLWRGILNRHAY